MKFQKPKGTEDLYGTQAVLFNNVAQCLVQTAKDYNYQAIITPIFEQEQLFLRAIGQETDIIEKEIYQFQDKGGRNLALRPEGTAGVIRAVIENKLYTNQKQTLKYFYLGSMYRYEQPQKGRKREFYQFGVEALVTKHPLLDVEIILLALDIVNKLEVKGYSLNLNFFGSEKTKETFQQEVLKSLKTQENKLCDDCKKRINTNPLRVLDCKIDKNLNLILPKLEEIYSQEETKYFNDLTTALNNQKVKFTIDQNLVRGLDYYNGMIFEINVDNDNLGRSQNTLVGGGRYDNLCQELGSPNPCPAVGFAFGVERLMLLLKDNPNFNKKNNLKLYIISQYEDGLSNSLSLLTQLRKEGHLVDANFSLYNDKQKSSLLNNIVFVDNVLVLLSDGQAAFHQIKSQKKINLDFKNIDELIEKLIKEVA